MVSERYGGVLSWIVDRAGIYCDRNTLSSESLSVTDNLLSQTGTTEKEADAKQTQLIIMTKSSD